MTTEQHILMVYKERDEARAELLAARAENERLAKHLADLRTWAEKWSKDEERESYERRGVWRLVARQIDMLTKHPKPAESRPWWEVFGRERWQGVAMHEWPRKDRERHIQVMADEAQKRGLAPNEIGRAVQEAAAELLGEQPKPAGGGA